MKETQIKIITVFSCFIFVAMVASSSGSTIEVVWMVPFTTPTSSTSSFKFNASSSIAALALGLETIQNQSILPTFDIHVTAIDTNCDSKQSLGALVQLLFLQEVHVVIGPPCAQVVQTVGELLSYINTPLLNWVSTSQTIDTKVDLSTYIRTMAPISNLGGIMTLFYYYTGWKRFVVISSEGNDYSACAKTVITNIGYHSINNFTVAHHYSEVKINVSQELIDEMLAFIIYEARIIILVIPRIELRRYMLRAHALGMTGGDYQFLFTEATLADNEESLIINSDILWKQGDQYDASARQAFENVLYFLLGHNMTAVSEWRDASYDAFDRVFQGRADVPAPTEPDEFSGYLHDTILLYAMALNTSLSNNGTSSGSDIFTWTYNQYFKGLSGDVVMNQLGDRQPTFYVYDLNEDGVFNKVASLQYTIDDTTNKIDVSSFFTTIRWGDGKTDEDGYIPPDTPPCGFFNENCPAPSPPTDSTNVIIISVSVTMLVVFFVLFMMYRWWRGEQLLKNMAWKINPSELNFSYSKKGQSSFISNRSVIQSSTGSSSSVTLQGTIRSGALSVQSTRQSITRGQIFTTVAMYKGEIVAVKMSSRKKLTLDRAFLMQMKNLVEMKHSNLTTFIGVCTVPEKICSVWEYCSKGSIQDVIENDDLRLDTMFKLSLAVDICQGLQYIHKSPIKFHGNMRSSNCVIDSRWVCKLTDYGLQKIKPSQAHTEETVGEHAFYARLFWTAPEILRKILKKEPYEGTQQADIFALGVIIKELLCRNEPYWDTSDLSPKEIITKVAYPDNEDNIFRPVISDTQLDSEYRQKNMEYLIQRCWAEDVDARPQIKAVLHALNKINPYKKSSVVDNMIAMMEKYTNNLEELVAERTVQLQEEKRKTDALLYRMLPKKVADDLKFGRSVQAEAFDSVTIYFSDIVEFTILASESTPLEIVALLNALYTLFDDIISHYDVYKVETIGDAYMIVSGLPERNDNLHVREIASVALDILKGVMTFQIPHKTDRQLQIRIGLHTGPAVAGVVGLTMPRYCLFGDTVNTASRMESNGKPLKIHISAEARAGLEAFPNFIIEDRGEILIKGKGLMNTYWLIGKYNSEADLCLDPHEFKTLTDPDKSTLDGSVDSQKVCTDTVSGGMKAFELSKGKLSVADSGIYMDKGLDDKDIIKSDIESDAEANILDQNIQQDSYNEGDECEEDDCAQKSDNNNLYVKEDAELRSNGYVENSKNETNDERILHSSREINSQSYSTIHDLFEGIPLKVLNLGYQVSKKENNKSDEMDNLDRDMSTEDTAIVQNLERLSQKGNSLLNSEQQSTRLSMISEKNDQDAVRLLSSNTRIQQQKPTGMNRTQIHTDVADGDGLTTTSTEQLKRENDDGDGDIFPVIVTKGTSIFNVPARISATDFMAVQNDWVDSDQNSDQ